MYTQYAGSSQVLGVYVSLVMFRQVVAPHEAFLTLAALEALVSCEETNKCWDPGCEAYTEQFADNSLQTGTKNI